MFEEFNISWLRGGHPVLNIGDLSVEASQNLGQLLDQLRFPTVKSLSNLTIIVLIKRYIWSLSGVVLIILVPFVLYHVLSSFCFYFSVFQLLLGRGLPFMVEYCQFYLVWILQALLAKECIFLECIMLWRMHSNLVWVAHTRVLHRYVVFRIHVSWFCFARCICEVSVALSDLLQLLKVLVFPFSFHSFFKCSNFFLASLCYLTF